MIAGQNYKKNKKRYTQMSDINVTPFVDVMLVLLIVFMVTAPLLTVGIPVVYVIWKMCGAEFALPGPQNMLQTILPTGLCILMSFGEKYLYLQLCSGMKKKTRVIIF